MNAAPQNIAVLGIGLMGFPMSKRLCEAGHHVTAWNRSIEKARRLQPFGAMRMPRELPLHMMASKIRTMRIYDGPTEVQQWVVARNLLGSRR